MIQAPVFLVARACIFAGLFVACCLLSAAPERPNVLFIAVDDLRPELGVYGSRAQTPNIDRLAASGLRFDRAYTAQAVCGASRVALMTGLYPEYTGERSAHVYGWRDRHPDVTTLNQFFLENDYNTVGVGKIYHNWEKPGIDVENWTTWFNTDGFKYYVDFDAVEQGIAQADEFGVKFLRGPTTEIGMRENAANLYYDGYRARVAVDQIGRLASGEQPFFFAVGFGKPHLPFAAPKAFWDLYDRDSFSMPDNLGIPPGYPEFASLRRPGEMRVYSDVPPGHNPKDFPEEMNKRLIHGYLACVSYMDWNVGRVLDALEASGAADNTIIVFWGDHGFKLGEHFSWCKHTVFETDTRVPLIVVDPRNKYAEGSTEALVELIDLYPTLAELCGLEAPAHLQGESFLSVLKDPEAPHRRYAYSSYPRRPNDDIIGHSLRSERYRYTEWWDAETDELLTRVATDLIKDPDETTNVLTGNESFFEPFAEDLQRIVQEARVLPGSEGVKRK
jgi:iduronate 2-sulfatase